MRDALDDVPPSWPDMMDNVVVLVEDEPPDGEPDDLLGALRRHAAHRARQLVGRGLAARPHHRLPRPDLAHVRRREEVVDEVAVTVVHEIAHHFGIDDARLHELGWA